MIREPWSRWCGRRAGAECSATPRPLRRSFLINLPVTVSASGHVAWMCDDSIEIPHGFPPIHERRTFDVTQPYRGSQQLPRKRYCQLINASWPTRERAANCLGARSSRLHKENEFHECLRPGMSRRRFHRPVAPLEGWITGAAFARPGRLRPRRSAPGSGRRARPTAVSPCWLHASVRSR